MFSEDGILGCFWLGISTGFAEFSEKEIESDVLALSKLKIYIQLTGVNET